MPVKERTGKIPLRRLLSALIPILLIALFFILSGIRPFANFMTDYFSRPVKDVLGTVLGIVPISFMELEYIAAGVFIIWYTVRTVVLTVRCQRHFLMFLKRCGIFILIIAYFLTFFLWCFAIDYRSDSFTEKSGIELRPVSTDELYAVTKYFLENAALYAAQVQRDNQGHYAQSIDSFLPSSKGLYRNISGEFTFLSPVSRVPKRMYLFSRISSAMGFTGVYFPFSGESNINIDAPGCLIPSTIAHELAHQKGVYAEQEANFVGITACISSGNTVYAYSGYLSGSIHLSNALYSADPDAWAELSSLLEGPLLTDWIDNNAYWASFRGPVEEVSSKVYDGYLKAQGQPLGIRSYGACVDLLVAYYLEAAMA